MSEGPKVEPLPNWAYYAVALTIAIAAIVGAAKLVGWL